MYNYGTDMQGTILVERVSAKEDWTPDDIGRVILDYSNGNFYFGAKDISYGDNGWIPVGMGKRDIKYYMLDWDDSLSGDENKISSLNIPCLYGDSTTYIQTAINSTLDEITALSKGEILQAGAIKSYHLDVDGVYRVDARIIPIENLDGYFPIDIESIEGALIHLIDRHAGDIFLDPDGEFGSKIGVVASTIQQSLDRLEDYLFTFSADEISATYPLSSENSTVQFILDAHYQLLQNISFKDLMGTPSNYGYPGQILKTDGVDSICFEKLVANDVFCYYPSAHSTNVQAALYDINQDIDELRNLISSLGGIDAEIVSYNGNSNFSDVDSALDWILDNTFTHIDPPVASDIKSVAISTTTNVQDALIYLQNQFNDIMSQLPCQVDANNVEYNSIVGHVNVREALDYLFSHL